MSDLGLIIPDGSELGDEFMNILATNFEILDAFAGAAAIFVTPVVTITRSGGASQAIVTTPGPCEILDVFVVNMITSPFGIMSLGWATNPTALMADAIVPKSPTETDSSKGTRNGIQAIRYPIDWITTPKNIIATVGGSGEGQWKVWLVIAKFA